VADVQLLQGDCLDVLRMLPASSVDAIVTDPPYGLGKEPDMAEVLRHWLAGDDYAARGGGFMGKSWDSFVPGPAIWKEAFRVLKPGGHVLSFFGTRTHDLGTIAMRLAGFEIRDMVAWVYGSGFPKSHDVSKGIDKRGGRPDLAHEIAAAIKAARLARGISAGQADKLFCNGSTNWTWYEGRKGIARPPTPGDFARIVVAWPELSSVAALVDEAERETVGRDTKARSTSGASALPTVGGNTVYQTWDITAPATEAARQWEGWGTALKPALEPVTVARKPLIGTVAENVLAHGTGALNIAGCRVGTEDNLNGGAYAEVSEKQDRSGSLAGGLLKGGIGSFNQPLGRWPANLIHDGSDEVVAAFPDLGKSPGNYDRAVPVGLGDGTIFGTAGARDKQFGFGDSGSAARFFYNAKASKRDRNAGLGDGANAHPTVKPTDLMRYLCRLITPPGGTVLDPFMGSGSTGRGAILEGFAFIGIEREAEYMDIARKRIAEAQKPASQPTLFAAE
jgi:DNA modification methylase